MQSKNTQIQKLRLYFNISLGIFLFVLFFQPFEINFEFNTVLIFIAGLSAISLIFLLLLNITLPWLFKRGFNYNEWKFNPDLFVFSVFMALNSVAYAFYIRYVGGISMSFFLVFKIILLSLASIVVLQLYKEYKLLSEQVHYLHEENSKLSSLTSENSEDENISETFFSDNRSDKIELELNSIIFINSADNYVKIVYIENEKINQKLIRNTLKNIEEQLRKYPGFFRCHRTCIVNKKHVTKLSKSYKGYRLTIENYNEEIPVSRQYILQVKELIGAV